MSDFLLNWFQVESGNELSAYSLNRSIAIIPDIYRTYSSDSTRRIHLMSGFRCHVLGFLSDFLTVSNEDYSESFRTIIKNIHFLDIFSKNPLFEPFSRFELSKPFSKIFFCLAFCENIHFFYRKYPFACIKCFWFVRIFSRFYHSGAILVDCIE